jgi:hypothetical protein
MKIPETNEESLEAEIQRRIGKLPEQTPAGAFISGDSREKRIIMEETSKFDKEKRQDFLTKKNTLIDEIRNINKEKTLPVTRNLFTLPSEKEDKEIQDENARYVTDLIKEKYGINTNTNNLQKISIDITNALEDNPEVFNEIMDIIQNKDNIEYLKSLKDEKKKNLETNKIITSPINDDVIELQNKHLTQKKKDGTLRFTYNNIEEAQEKLNDLSSVLLYIESDGNFDAANPNKEGVVDEQSARGGYQFKPDSIDPAIVRLERVMGPMPRFDIVKKTKDARDLSPEDQTLLVMADILEKTAVVNKEKRPGYGDTLIQNYLDAETAKEKRDAVYEIYKILHHTGDTLPFKAKINTTRKLRKYFNE